MSRDGIKLKNLFQSDILSLQEILCGYYYSIPIYQRDYSWDKEAVKRLFISISEGISNLERDEESITFLGTIICTKLNHNLRPASQCRNAFSLVDGQQRLTTLLLACSVIHQYITERRYSLEIDKTTDAYKFFDSECEYLDSVLHDSMLEKYDSRSKNFFPRIIREMDDSWKQDNAKYESPVAYYVDKYKERIDQHKKGYQPAYTPVKVIQKYINQLCGDRKIDQDSDEMALPDYKEMIKKENYRNILFRDTVPSLEKWGEILEQHKEARELLYYIAFSNYMLERVAFSLIESEKEKYAFDIFEALNTTGEPLTAIETLKPLVVDAKNKKNENEYKNSKYPKKWFDNIDHYLRKEERFSSLAKQQKESAEIVLNFALLYNGDKESRHLGSQRTYLREKFAKLKKDTHRDKFIQSIHDTADYRRKFWTNDDLSNVKGPIKNDKIALFCLLLLKKMNMSITVPILTRYYTEGHPLLFSAVVKVLSSFVVIWRAYHGRTEGIDNKFRALMKPKGNGNLPACMGERFEKDLLDVNLLKQYLRDFLKKGSGDGSIDDKSEWVENVAKQPLYKRNQPLCKFILLASLHQTGLTEEDSFLLEKEERSLNKDYMTIDKWHSKSLETIEHVAPQNPQDNKVDKDFIDTIGNLMLLPREKNSILGNRPWEYKRKLIKIFSERKFGKVEDYIKEAEKEGIKISDKAKLKLFKEECLPTISHLLTVQDWTTDVIKTRSENLASLTWDTVRPWLDD